MRRKRERLASHSARRPVHRPVAVVLSSGAGARRRHHRRLGRRRVPPELVMSAASTSDSAVGQLLGLEQLFVLGNAQSLAVNHARALRSRSETQQRAPATMTFDLSTKHNREMVTNYYH